MRVPVCLPVLVLSLAAGVTAADSTRQLTAELVVGHGEAFVVENLAGTMTVLPGDSDRVLATATVHADSEQMAATIRIEQVRGENGVATLRVVYPLDDYRRFQYPGAGSSDVTYARRRVRVGSPGPVLYADVEVRVPRRAVNATFRNLVGSLSAEGLDGQILLDAASADVTVRGSSGTITADTGSGDVKADNLKGALVCDTGSGDCSVTRFDGEELRCDTGSGAVRVSNVRASRLTADTGSGVVLITGADVEELKGDTGSGRVEIEVTGARLRSIAADTGSGDVVLRVPPDTAFEIKADQGSGDLHCGFQDAQAIVHSREVVGYRRGEGKVGIAVDTGSGSVTLNPI